MTVLITLTLAGSDTGPFDIYSNSDGFTTPLVTGISRAALLAGYYLTTVPNDATQILVRSTGVCDRSLYLDIAGAPTTTTTTTSSSSTTTTTTTIAPTITLSFQPFDKSWTILSNTPVPQTVYFAGGAVDGFASNSCITQIAGATLSGGILGLNVGQTVDSAPSGFFSGAWGTTTPYRFSSPLITLTINGVNYNFSDGDTILISGSLFTIYISTTCI
jgi:hypothetical protein